MLQQTLKLSALLIASSLLSSCGEKARLHGEVVATRAAKEASAAVLKATQAESAAVGELGSYNYPEQAHIDQLRALVSQLNDEKARLTAAKLAAEKNVELLRTDLDAYRARHLKTQSSPR